MSRLLSILFSFAPLTLRERLGIARRHLVSIGKRAAMAHQGVYIDPSAQILGWKYVRLGPGTSIGEGVCININCFTEANVELGRGCFIGRRCFFSPGDKLSIGDACVLGPECSLVGADHASNDPMRPVLLAGITSGTIRIEANCWLGTKVVVLKNVSIGRGSTIAASSVVTKDIPPFSLAAGVPAKVVKRFDFATSSWVPDKDFSKEMEGRLPSEPQYLEMLLTAPAIRLRAPIQSATSRFGEW